MREYKGQVNQPTPTDELQCQEGIWVGCAELNIKFLDLRSQVRQRRQVMLHAQLPDAQAGQPRELQMEAGMEFYFEGGELGKEFNMNQTQEEKGAGL